MRVSDHNKVIADMITCVFVSLICKLVPPLSKNQFVTISRPILHITVLTRYPDPCFQGQPSLKDHSWINYVCSWQAMQIIKCQHYRINCTAAWLLVGHVCGRITIHTITTWQLESSPLSCWPTCLRIEMFLSSRLEDAAVSPVLVKGMTSR